MPNDLPSSTTTPSILSRLVDIEKGALANIVSEYLDISDLLNLHHTSRQLRGFSLTLAMLTEPQWAALAEKMKKVLERLGNEQINASRQLQHVHNQALPPETLNHALDTLSHSVAMPEVDEYRKKIMEINDPHQTPAFRNRIRTVARINVVACLFLFFTIPFCVASNTKSDSLTLKIISDVLLAIDSMVSFGPILLAGTERCHGFFSNVQFRADRSLARQLLQRRNAGVPPEVQQPLLENNNDENDTKISENKSSEHTLK